MWLSSPMPELAAPAHAACANVGCSLRATCCRRLSGSEVELAASMPLHITVRASHIASAERRFCIAARRSGDTPYPG